MLPVSAREGLAVHSSELLSKMHLLMVELPSVVEEPCGEGMPSRCECHVCEPPGGMCECV